MDAKLSIARGTMYKFNQLQLEGLDAATEQWARGHWKLAQGSPMNAPYVDDFLRTVSKSERLAGVKSFVTEMKPVSEAVVDVHIKFRAN